MFYRNLESVHCFASEGSGNFWILSHSDADGTETAARGLQVLTDRSEQATTSKSVRDLFLIDPADRSLGRTEVRLVRPLTDGPV